MTTTTTTKITIFDTTLRDGEMALKRKFTIQQKIQLAKLLEAMKVDVIEVGYPGAASDDVDKIFMVSKQVKTSIICGLASSRLDEIAAVAVALKPADRGRINIFTPVQSHAQGADAQLFDTIKEAVSLARNYCEDVEWSAFDATRSDPDRVCKAVETAIKYGATTIAIPDSMGVASPPEFSALLKTIKNRVPNIDQAVLAVHCHDDQGFAVENSLIGLESGVRQIECSINGLGARAGNAGLIEVVKAIAQHLNYHTSINPTMLQTVSDLVHNLKKSNTSK
ncbi:MAG: 2-isopropylmalate synthase [Synechococcales bacterium]|nr:2-isopropylmalate synthase [Synechococcales bacterium]